MAGHDKLDTESDYGSDFSPEDELLLIQLLPSIIPGTAGITLDTIAHLDALPGETDTLCHYERSKPVPESDLQGSAPRVTRQASSESCPGSQIPESPHKHVTYPDLSRALSKINSLQADTGTKAETPDSDSDSCGNDCSPLQRFRSYPKKPLSVTDLTSGAWCELQYWYTLTKLPGGRRTKTAAMKCGSRFHQKLQDEVHATVQIDVSTKEDGFALRLWNFVQGLRTLRDTGLTRELEVWGLVDGNIVNGVIDVVSYKHPNPDFERELVEQIQRDPKQRSLSDFFPQAAKTRHIKPTPRIYIADVKTRGSVRPVNNALLRPAKIQLMLYHQFLSQIAAGRLDFLKLFRRYGLDPDDTLSDGFIAQMGDLHDEVFHNSPSYPDSSSEENRSCSSDGRNNEEPSRNGQLKFSTLRKLSKLVQAEVELTFPEAEASMGHMLQVQYVHRDDGREIDIHDFPTSSQVLDEYLKSYMRWWQGEREAVGVDIEEAYKCRICEFADECSWRNAMAEKHIQKARETASASRRVSEDSVSR